MSTLRRAAEEPCLSDFDLEAYIWGDLSAQGRQRLRVLLEQSLETELTQRLGYEPYQRDPSVHTDYRNGYYSRSIDTQFGAILGLRVPRLRFGKMEYAALRQYARRAPWVNRLIREMFVAGVSTRRVGQIMFSLLEASVSAATVSRVCERLDSQVREWHARPVEDAYQYLILDGVRIKVRSAQRVVKRVVLCVYGITPEGKRELIDYRIATAESEAQWVALLEDLRRRGFSGERVALAVTDGGQGLINALAFVFPRIPLQRCWAHKLRNVSSNLKVSQRQECLKQAGGIYQASSQREAVRRFRAWKTRWQQEAPKAVACLERDLDSLLAFLRCPKAHWIKVRTTNAIERQFRELRRRTDPMTCFPHEASADRILYAVFHYANQRWSRSLLKEFTQDS